MAEAWFGFVVLLDFMTISGGGGVDAQHHLWKLAAMSSKSRHVSARRRMGLAAVFLGGAVSCANAQTAGTPKVGDLITGTASVVDGGALDIKSNRIRIWGIDAPERGAWCYRNGTRWKPQADSTKAMRHCVQGKIVTCRIQRIERYWFRRWHTSECWTNENGQDVGECMIRAGWATDYTCFSDGYYRDLETEAKNKGLGLWQCDNGPTTRRWGRQGAGARCETPVYRPSGPGPK